MWSHPIISSPSSVCSTSPESKKAKSRIVSPVTNRPIALGGSTFKSLVSAELIDEYGIGNKRNLDVYRSIKESSGANNQEMKSFCSIMSMFKSLKNTALKLEILNQIQSYQTTKDIEISDDVSELYSLIQNSSLTRSDTSLVRSDASF